MAGGRKGRKGRNSSNRGGGQSWNAMGRGMHGGSTSMAGGGQRPLEVMRQAPHGGSVATAGQSSVQGARTFADFDWPSELVLRIIALMPLLNVLRYRGISQQWNALLFNPYFRELRESLQHMNIMQEFVNTVTRKYSLKHWRLQFDRIVGDWLSMVKHEDIFLLQPLSLAMRRLPRLQCTAGIGVVQRLHVVGLIVNEATHEFVMFVVSRVIRTVRRNHFFFTIGQGPEAQGMEINLHCYNPTTNVWAGCGDGLELNLRWREIHSMTVHRGFYMALVKNESGRYEAPWPHDRFTYDFYIFNHFHSVWEKLRVDYPGRIPHREAEGVSIFDHRGTLYLAKPSRAGCSVWKFMDDACNWVLLREFQNPARVDIESAEQWWDEIEVPYTQHLADCLHFGSFEPPPDGRGPANQRSCRMLMYNLSTGMLTDVSKSDMQVQSWLVKVNLQKAQCEIHANGRVP